MIANRIVPSVVRRPSSVVGPLSTVHSQLPQAARCCTRGGSLELVLILLSCIALTTSGCALALVGAGAAAGTYAMVQGSAEGFSDAKYDRIWKAAKAVLEEKGTLTSDDEAGGVLKGKVADTDVTVELVKITEASTKMRVTARKNLLPREKLAEEVYTAIAKKL